MPIDLPPHCKQLLNLQHGVIACRQAMLAGLSTRTMEQALRSGRWQSLYRGVYAAFTGRPSRLAWQWAAVLRIGPDAALSHYTAAELDGLAEAASVTAVHVTADHDRRIRLRPDEGGPGAPQIMLHRSDRIESARHPARTPPRTRIPDTVIDLTQLASDADGVFAWLTRGCGRRLVTPDQLRAVAERRGKLRWRREILAGLDDVVEGVHSSLERRYVRDVERSHGLPAAKRQVHLIIGSRSAYLDNLYDRYAVGVELDGLASHPVEERWADIHRDNSCGATGLRILRYNWADVTVRRCASATQVGGALQRGGWTGTLRRCGPSCPAFLP